MCDRIREEEIQQCENQPHEDVDDLIFRDEKEWLVSDR